MANQPMPVAQDAFFAPSEQEPELHLLDWFDVVKRRKRLLFVTFAVVLAASLLLYATTPKSFKATTMIQIERRVASPVKMDEAMMYDSYLDAQSFYPTQLKILQSRGLAERVVKNLRLAEDPVFNPNRSRLLTLGQSSKGNPQDDEKLVADLAEKLLGGLSVDLVRDTRLVQLSYVAPTAELAARIANGVAAAYVDLGVELRGETVGKASSFLASQIEALKQEIADKEARLQAYSRSTDIVVLDPSSNVVMQRLQDLNKAYMAAMANRIDKEARYQELTSSPKEATADAVSGGLVTQLRSDLLKLQRDYASKLSTYKPDWPAMQDLKAQIEKAQQNLDGVVEDTVGKAVETAKADYQTALRREQSLADELARQKADAMQQNSAAVEYNNLKLEVSTRRDLLNDLLRRRSETEMASRLQGSGESNVSVVDRALVPESAFRPSLPRNLGLGIVLGLGLGLGAVFGAEYLDRTLKTPEDVERVLGLPMLAMIPDVSTAKGGRYGYRYGRYGYYSSYYGYGRKKAKPPTPPKDAAGDETSIELVCASHPRLAVSEAYRSLRTAVLLSTASSLQTVLVTSAAVGEGKTATAGNLAVVLAQLGRHVLLIDCDLRKPRQHSVFKVPNRAGVVSYLTGQAEPAEVFVRTAVANLYVAPSGPIPPDPAELLSSDRMREFMTLARQRFDYIVIDSPPVLPVTDASILSALVDGVVMCLGAGQVLRDDARAAQERLMMVEAKILGAVLNRFRLEERGRYSKNYYRHYEHYLQDSESGEASEAPTRAAG